MTSFHCEDVSSSYTARNRRTMTAALVLILAWFGVIATAQAKSSPQRPPSIAYRFQLVTIGDKSAFHVEVGFRAASAVTTIVVPTHWGSAAHLEDQTQALKVLTPGAALESTSDPGNRKLRARPGQQITLAYDIVPLQSEWFSHPQEHMAIINADYFLFNPENALVFPTRPDTSLVDAMFDFRALPPSTSIFSSFGNSRLIHVRAPWYKLRDALFAGGNFRVTQAHENGATLVFAARGTWKFTDAEAFAQIRRVFNEENKFWHAQPAPFFLVTLAPFDQKSGSNDGSGFTNAFMLFLSHEDEFDAARVRLLAHEMFHHWNPLSMGPTPADESVQWFSEGFTVYYEAAIPLRAGLISYADYLSYLNRRLSEYQTSRLRNLKNVDWQKAPHSSGQAYVLSYARGAAIALWADSAIRERSGNQASLDNIMFDLVNQARGPNPPELTEDRIFSAFARYLAPDQVAEIRAMAVDGADVPLPATLGRCAQLEHVTKTIVDVGFDTASLESKHVAGVDPEGAAYRAGIRDGQVLFRWSIYNDDPSKEVQLGVVIDGKQQVIHYSPAKQLEFEQYCPTASEGSSQSCAPF